MDREQLWQKYRYFSLSLGILVADQISKLIVEARIPLHSVAWSWAGDFFRLIHVRNQGVAFSMGSNLAGGVRSLLFIAVPLIVLVIVAAYLVRGKDLTTAQRWTLAAILGGGLGNQVDRVFRPDGVVDFLDFKFYGLFGLERWPTFNIADASLVVASIVLVILLFIQEVKLRKS